MEEKMREERNAAEEREAAAETTDGKKVTHAQ